MQAGPLTALRALACCCCLHSALSVPADIARSCLLIKAPRTLPNMVAATAPLTVSGTTANVRNAQVLPACNTAAYTAAREPETLLSAAPA